MVNEVKLLVDRHRNVVVLRHGVVTRGSVTSFAVESLFKTVGDCWPIYIHIISGVSHCFSLLPGVLHGPDLQFVDLCRML